MRNRRSIRLPEYDYSWPGAYFVTISTHEKKPAFGKINGFELVLSAWGKIAEYCWLEIPKHFEHVELDAFIVMPNHVHGILWLTESKPRQMVVGARHASPSSVRATHASPLRPSGEPRGPARLSIGAIVGSYKSSVSRIIKQHNKTKAQIWQRNYYERVIRDDSELDAIRNYVIHNAIKDLALPFQRSEKLT